MCYGISWSFHHSGQGDSDESYGATSSTLSCSAIFGNQLILKLSHKVWRSIEEEER